MRPQSAKQKGRKHQQAIRDDILQAFPHLTPDDVRSVSMGASGEDILMSTQALQDVPLSIEAKCVERLNIYAAIEQCIANCRPQLTPCIVFRKNRMKPFAAVPWSFLLTLVAQHQTSTTAVDPAEASAESVDEDKETRRTKRQRLAEQLRDCARQLEEED